MNLPDHVYIELLRLRQTYQNTLLRDGWWSPSVEAVRNEARRLVARGVRDIRPGQTEAVIRRVWKEGKA